jgi:hypothetical protein
VRVDKLHCSSTTVETLEQRYWKSSMAHNPRLPGRNVYDSPAKYESSNRVGRLARENCRLSASISPQRFVHKALITVREALMTHYLKIYEGSRSPKYIVPCSFVV